MDKVEVTLTKEKETKRMIRYTTEDEEALVGNIYILKTAFNGTIPNAVTVKVEAA